MLTINAQRLQNDLKALSKIGATKEGGVSRPALSAEDIEARRWFRERSEAVGLQVRQDGAGNLSAILLSSWPNAKTLLIGSHLDTVPNGGRFDGALGVLAALEVARTVQEANIELPFHLEVINFTDEEGTVLGLLGSRALTGQLSAEDLQHPRCDPQTMTQGMQRLGLSPESIMSSKRTPGSFVAFIEVHIEQGTRLEKRGIDIGVVTSIVGIRSYWLTFIGQAAHAGTLPMHQRFDALWGASAFVQEARSLVMEKFTPGVLNVGQVHVSPGVFNIVPAEAKLALEFRHGTEAHLNAMQAELLDLAQKAATDDSLKVEIEPANQVVAASMDSDVVDAIERAAQKLQLKSIRLLSFAGHDTQAMSLLIPSAMFFVPSVNGVSHHPQEFTHPKDCVNAGNVLLHSVLGIADYESPSTTGDEVA
jgi:N-carbamoyl-L-amino-acid hydrolase